MPRITVIISEEEYVYLRSYCASSGMKHSNYFRAMLRSKMHNSAQVSSESVVPLQGGHNTRSEQLCDPVDVVAGHQVVYDVEQVDDTSFWDEVEAAKSTDKKSTKKK
jgi:hypothetical protein